MTRAKLKAGGPNKRISSFFQVGLLAAVALVLLAVLVSSFLPPSIAVGQERIFFGAEDQGVATRPQTIPIVIQNKLFGAHRDLLWQARPEKDWLIVRPKTGRGAGSIEVRPVYRRLPPGTYRAKIAVTCSGTVNSPQEIEVILDVFQKGASSPPFGYVDRPANGESVRGHELEVWGWALDDIEVSEVRIKRSPFPDESSRFIDPDGLVAVGKAKIMDAVRPDVEKAFPRYPLMSRAIWWLSFPIGDLPAVAGKNLTIHVVLLDKEGHRADLPAITVKLAR